MFVLCVINLKRGLFCRNYASDFLNRKSTIRRNVGSWKFIIINKQKTIIKQTQMGNTCSKKPRDLNNQQSLAVQGVINEEEANLLNSGKMLEDQGDIQNAMNTYVMAAKINPKSSLAYQGIGNCHLKMGDFARAIDDYERSVSLDPNNKFSYNGLGVAYQSVKNDSRALKNFNRAIEIDPSFSYPYNGLGNLHYQNKNYSQSLTNFENALKMNPDNPMILANLACCQSALGRHDEAMTTFRRAGNEARNHNISGNQRQYLSTRLKEFSELIGKSDPKYQNEVHEFNQQYNTAF